MLSVLKVGLIFSLAMRIARARQRHFIRHEGEQHDRRQVLERPRVRNRRKVFRGHDGAVDSPEMTHDEIKLADRTCAEPEIIAAGDEIARLVRQSPVDGDRGMPDHKTRCDGRENGLSHPHRNSDADQPGQLASLVSQRIEGGFPMRQHRAGILQKVVAGIRQRELVCRAPHELCAEQVLELFELAARGRLRNGERLRRRRQRTGLGDPHE
jgi:hypothetical protein